MGTRAAGLVIFRRISDNIQYLMLQTSYGTHHWTPPKGHVDRGETDMTTALRETKEEAGLDVQDIKIYEDAKQTVVYNVKGSPKTVTYWLAELINPNQEIKLSNEHQDLKWLPFAEACEIGFYQEMKSTLQFCDNYIRTSLLK